MNIKVKEVNLVEEKSAQEIEADLLKKHEEGLQETPQNEKVEVEEKPEAPVEEAPVEASENKTPSSEL